MSGLRETKVQNLYEVVVFAIAAQEDICRLDVTMDETARFGLRQRVADLSKDVNDTFSRYDTKAFDQRIGIHTIKQFHDVVERTLLGDPEVEQRDRVRRSVLCNDLRFPLDPPTHGFG